MKETATPSLAPPERSHRHHVSASVAGAFDFNASHLALSLTRIAFFWIVLCEMVQLYGMRQVSFIPSHQWIGSLVLPLEICFLAAIVLGFKTRLSCIAHYFLFVWLILVTAQDTYHFDFIVSSISLLFIFAPAPKTLSIDSKLKGVDNPRQLIPTWFFIAFTMGLFQIYFDSLIYKCQSQVWLKGIVAYLAALPYRTIVSFPEWLEIAWLIKAMSYFAFAFEAAFVLVLLRKARPVIGVLGFVFHLGITVLCGIPWFGLGMAALFLFYIKWEELLEPFKLKFFSEKPFGGKDHSVPILYAFPAVIFALQISLLFGEGNFYVLQATGVRRHPLYIDANFVAPFPVLRFVAYDGDRKFEIPTFTEDCHLRFPYSTGRYYETTCFRLRGCSPNPNIVRFVDGWLLKKGFDAEFVKVYSHDTSVALELNFNSNNLMTESPWTESGRIVYPTDSNGVSVLEWNDWYKAKYMTEYKTDFAGQRRQGSLKTTMEKRALQELLKIGATSTETTLY